MAMFMLRKSQWAQAMQTVKAFLEAESYDGPSIIIAYSHCIAHGINMEMGLISKKRLWIVGIGFYIDMIQVEWMIEKIRCKLIQRNHDSCSRLHV